MDETPPQSAEGRPDDPGERPPRRAADRLFQVAVLCELGLALLALALSLLFGPDLLAALGLREPSAAALLVPLGWGLVATLPLAVALPLLDRVRFGPFGELHEVVDDHIRPVFQSMSVLQLAVISLLAGFGEELLFRGWLQAGLAEWIGGEWGMWLALGAASVLFGLCHAVTRLYAVLAAIAGLYFGGLMLFTDHLLPSVVAHALYDFLALLYLTRRGN